MRPNWFDRIARDGLIRQLAQIQDGRLTLEDPHFGPAAEVVFGESSPDLGTRVVVRNPRFYRALALRGAIGGAESYMDGDWWTNDLAEVTRLLARNASVVEGFNGGAARAARLGFRMYHWLHRNTREGSRRNIASHYDLGDDFYSTFLDPTMTYSAGIFEHEDTSMEEASLTKYERLCQKLDLQPEDHLLEIGTGWGGFAIYAAQTRGCKVTTTTISRNQYEIAQKRIAEAGLSERISMRMNDYRDLSGTFDKLASIEMIEAVGAEHLAAFFRVCHERLKPDGVMALQAITIPDRDFDAHCDTVDFIKRYIFPGGNLVSLGALGAAAAESGDLRVTHIEDLAPHYAETLRRWRQRFLENLPEIQSLGFDETFQRMWEFYLCYCEGGFDERQIGVAQVVLEKSRTRRPPLLGALSP